MTDRFKQALRRTSRLIRKKLPIDFQRHTAHKICARIRQMEVYRYAKRIALYQATAGEVDLQSIWTSAPLQGKYCYFPALNDDLTLSFLPATPVTPFLKNRFGIDEPSVLRESAIKLHELDLLLIPMLLFSHEGTRLGFGAGYYDRTLAEEPRPMLMGVAYEFQRQSFIESSPTDVSMNVIVTERNIYWNHQKQ